MEHGRHLGDVLILLAAAVACVPLFERLRLGPVLGYLAAGLVIGPYGLGLIDGLEQTRAIAEFGVVFLLFNVGLDLKLDRLRLIGPRVYVLGLAQTVVTTVLITLVALWDGLSPAAAVVIGGGLALSSTAVVIKVLQQMGRLTTSLGRTTIAVLLIQDLAVGPLLVLVEVLSTDQGHLGSALALAGLKAAAVLAAIIVLQRTVLRPLLRLAAGTRSPEVFVAAVLLLVLGAGWATEQAGLSMVLGAFLAGLMVADSEYRHQVAADIQPFRGLLLGLFFITVGMTVDLGLALTHWPQVAAGVMLLMAGKFLVTAGLARMLGFKLRDSVRLAALLAQGGEFAFVLFGLALVLGVMNVETAQLLTVIVAISMALAPLVLIYGQRVLLSVEGERDRPLGNLSKAAGGLGSHVIIAGFGQVGKAVARHLSSLRVPVVIIDLNAGRVQEGRTRKLPVFYGNAGHADVLREANAENALAYVIALPDEEDAEQAVAVATQAFPDLWVFARAPDGPAVETLLKAGADAVALDGLTTAMELAERVMLVHEDAPAPQSPPTPAGPQSGPPAA